MSEIKWIKLAADVFDNRKIRQIEALPDGDSVIVIWFKILCLSGTVNDNGLIYLTHDVPYTEEMLATEFNRPINIIRLALKTFEQFKMIEITDDIIRVSNWEKYQNIDGMEKIREQTRRRVAKHREQKQLCNATCNVTVTQCNATDKEEDIDIDKEKEKEIYKEKESVTKHTYGSCDNVLLTDDEVDKLKNRFPGSWQQKIENLSQGIALKGYKYKSHYLAILNWYSRDVEKLAAKWCDKEQAQALIAKNGLDCTLTEFFEQLITSKGGFLP